MTTQRFALATMLIALAAALSGCSSTRHSSSSSSSGAPFATDSHCGHGNSCMYNGHYDPGERDYAEQEARRLNQAEYERLRSSFK
jgi:hypothetical protein